MFKQRLFTTLILVPCVLMLLFFAPLWLLGAMLMGVFLLGGWEWMQLIPLKNWLIKIFFISVLVCMIGLCALFMQFWLIVGLILWGLILLAVLTYPASITIWGHRVIVGLACLLLWPLFANALAAIYKMPEGTYLVVYLLFLIWSADVGAYLVGKQFGKNKLIPQVSPGKTVEGVLGGVLTAMLISWSGMVYFSPVSKALWLALAFCTIVISILGDLFISILKRRCHLKDSGQIFPGHGGVLDRFDSLMAAAPLFYFGLRAYF